MMGWQTDNNASTSSLLFAGRMPFVTTNQQRRRPINSVIVVKANQAKLNMSVS